MVMVRWMDIGAEAENKPEIASHLIYDAYVAVIFTWRRQKPTEFAGTGISLRKIWHIEQGYIFCQI